MGMASLRFLIAARTTLAGGVWIVSKVRRTSEMVPSLVCEYDGKTGRPDLPVTD